MANPSQGGRAAAAEWPARDPPGSGRDGLGPRFLDGEGQAVYKIVIMQKQAEMSRIQVSALWEYEGQDRAERAQREMTAAGLPLNVQRMLRGLIKASNQLCRTAKGECQATTKQM